MNCKHIAEVKTSGHGVPCPYESLINYNFNLYQRIMLFTKQPKYIFGSDGYILSKTYEASKKSKKYYTLKSSLM